MSDRLPTGWPNVVPDDPATAPRPTFREPVAPPPPAYVFPGVLPFVHAAADAAGVHPIDRGESAKVWHVQRSGHLLGQLAGVPAEGRAGVVEHLRTYRAGLVLALAGLDAATAHAFDGLGIEREPVDDRPAAELAAYLEICYAGSKADRDELAAKLQTAEADLLALQGKFDLQGKMTTDVIRDLEAKLAERTAERDELAAKLAAVPAAEVPADADDE